MLSDGLILDQNALDSPYGRQGSAAAGCGWVAVYNALRLLGIPADRETVRAQMERLLILGGWNGTPFYALALYLRQKGVRVRFTLHRSKFGRAARKSQAGIVFYLYHKKGRPFPIGHFAAFAPTADGRCHFYNDFPGKADDLRTMTQFRKDRPALFMLLMCLRR